MKKLIITSIALLCCLTMVAGSVTERAAREKAARFMLSKKADAAAARGAMHFGQNGGAEATLTVAEQQAAFYVFNIDSVGGYVIVSGDDRMPDVLGYSYSGSYNPETLAPNMRSWLEGYADQYEYLQTHDDAKAVKQTSVTGERIEPLLTTHWFQDYPYNAKCPVINGERAVTGCIATAMAQVMNYHQWPKQTTTVIPGYGIGYYDTEEEYQWMELPALGITEIDWDHMLPSYDGSETAEEIDAVATLMQLCGHAVVMKYGLDGSGAKSENVRNVLPDFFAYDGFMMGYANRGGYENDAWNQLIYNELSINGPVMYDGSIKSSSGHAFVIDGYDTNDYFHVNWGWGGENDGYFLLNALLVYNFDQGATIGVMRCGEGPSAYAVVEDSVLTFYYDNKQNQRSGKVYTRLPTYYEDSYLENFEEITSAVFDPSFADFHEMTDASSMFRGLYYLEKIEGLEYLDTRKVTNMNHMFCNCLSLTSLDVSGFDTHMVSDMVEMFYGCESLTSLDLSNFDTHRVPNMESMFYNCYALETLDISSFNTENVTDMNYMFASCKKLKELDVSGWDTHNVEDMRWMFYGCEQLQELDVSGWDTGNVDNMECMFSGCLSVKALDVSGFDTRNVRYMYYMFAACRSLTSLDCSGFSMQSNLSTKSMFSGCSQLASVSITGETVKVMDYTFRDCTSLRTLTCYAEVPPTVGKKAFDEVPRSEATLYVPASSVEAYKEADEWKEFGTILPIEPTAVKEMKVSNASNAERGLFHDLSGRRYNDKPKNGIYIHQGKKWR